MLTGGRAQAQCEMKRLGIPPEQPLAVQQWQSAPPLSSHRHRFLILAVRTDLIAVNYPARARGVSRLVCLPPSASSRTNQSLQITDDEARKLCPEVQLVHVRNPHTHAPTA